MSGNLKYEVGGPVTQSIDGIKNLLAWKGVATDPLPQDITLNGGRLVLVLSKKKDAYYVTTERSCSCPSATYHPGQKCKHRATYFTQPNQPEEDLRASLPGWPGGAHGPVEVI